MKRITGQSGQRFGVGIIGAGSRGVGNLATRMCEIYAQHHLKPVAICDVQPTRLGEAQSYLQGQMLKHDVPGQLKAYRDAAALIADPAVHVVLITTPQYAHEEPFRLAAESGKIVFCDKPLAASEDACDRMLEVYRRQRPRTMVGFTRRYENAWRKTADLIHEGAIGSPRMILIRSIIPFNRYFHGGWWRKKALSGDLLNEKCSHHFDVFNWYSDSHPVRVYAQGGRKVFDARAGYPETCLDCSRLCHYRTTGGNDHLRSADLIGTPMRTEVADDPQRRLSQALCVYSPEADIIDHATVNLTFANGMVGTLFFSVFGQHGDEDQETAEVIGERGRVSLSRHRGRVDLISEFGELKASHDCRGENFGSSHFGADYRVVKLLSRLCTDGVAPPVGFEEAYRASKAAFAAHRSIATHSVQHPGLRLTVEEAADTPRNHDAEKPREAIR